MSRLKSWNYGSPAMCITKNKSLQIKQNFIRYIFSYLQICTDNLNIKNKVGTKVVEEVWIGTYITTKINTKGTSAYLIIYSGLKKVVCFL